MITNLYVDGFNLYNRAVKNTPFKWLDLRKLAETLFPADDIQRICFFTALVQVTPQRPHADRAASIVSARSRHAAGPGRSIFGEFRERIKHQAAGQAETGRSRRTCDIRDTEEKGSDVNLATRLLVGGFTGDYEQAVVVSNDSDLAEPRSGT